MSVSTDTRKQLHKVDDTDGVLALLKIDHPSFSEPLCLVNDTRDITTLGDDYIALPFRVTLPADKAKESPRARLQMDNVGRDIGAELEALPPGATLQATLRIVHRSTPGVVDYEFTAPLSTVQVNTTSVSAVMGPGDIMRRPAVLVRFDPVSAPGLFSD